MSDQPPDHIDGPVKERAEPVACTECGRVNWSNLALCVYCRLGWPDPGDLRGVPPDRDSVGHLRLDQPTPRIRPGQRQAPAVHRMDDGRVLRDVAVDVAGRFVEDVQCVRCRYNLRGLGHSDVCPECGGLVEDSLRVNDMAAADPRWLRAVHSGASLLAAGIWLVALSPFFGACIGVAFLLVMACGAIMMSIGVFQLTSPQHTYEPDYVVSGINETYRTWARWTCFSIVLPVVFLVASVYLAMSNQTAVPIELVSLTAVAIIALVGTCGTMTMLLLATYAEKLQSPDLASLCKVIAIVYTVSLCIAGLATVATFTSPAVSTIGFNLLLLWFLSLCAGVIVGLVSKALGDTAKLAQGSAPVPR